MEKHKAMITALGYLPQDMDMRFMRKIENKIRRGIGNKIGYSDNFIHLQIFLMEVKHLEYS